MNFSFGCVTQTANYFGSVIKLWKCVNLNDLEFLWCDSTNVLLPFILIAKGVQAMCGLVQCTVKMIQPPQTWSSRVWCLTKTNCKWFKGLNIRHDTIKYPRREYRQNILLHKLYQDFLRSVSQDNRNKSKTKQMGPNEIYKL